MEEWTEKEDVILAETVLRHVREGSTMIAGFEESGKKLNRSCAACGFRWNAVVRHDYVSAFALAKKVRVKKK